MKKIFTLSCVVASFMTLGVVSSCKDYNEDLRSDFETTISQEKATIWEQLKAQENALKAADLKIDNLKSYTDAELAKLAAKICDCTKCCDIKTIQDVIQDPAFQAEIQRLIGNSHSDPNFKTDVENIATASIIKKLLGNAEDGLSLTEALDKYIANYLAGVQLGHTDAEIQALFDKWVADKGYITDLTAVLNRISALETAKETLEKDINTLNTTLGTVQGTVGEHATSIASLVSQMATVNSDIATINSTIADNYKTLDGKIGVITGDVEGLKKDVADLTKDLNDAKTACASGLQEVKEMISTLEQKLKDEQEAAKAYVATEIEKALEDVKKDIADALYFAAEYTDKMIANLNFDDKYFKIEDVKDWLTPEALEDILASKGYLTADQLTLNDHITYDELKAYVGDTLAYYVTTEDLNLTVNELNEAIATAESGLQTQINDLATRVSNIESEVSTLSGKLDALTGRVDNMKARLDAQITGIIVQGVATPMLFNQTLAMPVGIQSNILTAYYGPKTGGSFPSVIPDADGDDDFSYGERMKDWTFTSDAGKVYFTVNPSNCDFSKNLEGMVLYLYDSQNNKSAIRLANVQPSDKQLQFGITRAANGFYEADAILDPNTADDNQLNIHMSDLKEVAGDIKSLLQSTSKNNIKDLAVDVAKLAVKGTQLPAYAMGIPYTYVDDNGIEVTQYVYSNYGIATVAIKPLGYGTINLNGVKSKIPHKWLPVIPSLASIIEESIVDIKKQLTFKFDEVELDLSEAIKPISVQISGVKLGAITATVTEDIAVTTDMNITYSIPHIESDGPVINHDPVTGKDTVEFVKHNETLNDVVVIINKDDLNGKIQVDLNKLENDINNQIIKSINDQLGQIEDLSTELSDLGGTIQDNINAALANTADTINDRMEKVVEVIEALAGKGDDYINKVNTYIGRFNNLLTKVYNKIDNTDLNIYLQPVMLIGNNGLKIASQISNIPTTFHAPTSGYCGVSLYPTTYTAEVINPAYKKFVKVIAARRPNGQNVEAAVDYANGGRNMAKVINGSERAVEFRTNAAYTKDNLTYEVVFVALDFHGNESQLQRYYIKVVK